MKILIIDTYHPHFLKKLYLENKGLKDESSRVQSVKLLSSFFGTSDFYSRHLNELGHTSEDVIANCNPLQIKWAQENCVPFNFFSMRVPYQLFQLPIIGSRLASLSEMFSVVVEQVKLFSPDVLYCQDLRFFHPEMIAILRQHVRHLIVGQIACPLPRESYIQAYDLILTSFPHFVTRIQSYGVAAEYFPIGFDPSVLGVLGEIKKDINFSFVGGISRHHGKTIPLLEHLSETTPIQFYGYGAKSLKRTSPIRKRHYGEVWGMDMYRTLARSKITLNRHINAAENNANNMRLYEATGVGSLLLTDQKNNLSEIFEIGKEVITYSNPNEASEMVQYYLQHPEEAEKIAKAGQARTLREHTYAKRMQDLVLILKKYLH